MSTLLLAAHADDETLFASYICQREKPLVIVCFDEGRHYSELAPAAGILGCPWVGFGLAPQVYDADALARHLSLEPYTSADRVWAPAYHFDGHEEHNLVGQVADTVFGDRVRYYLTYAPRGQRQTEGFEVVPTAEEIARKLRAMACYVSQIEYPATRPWFFDLLDMREFTA